MNLPTYRGKRAIDLALILLSAPAWIPLLVVLGALVYLGMGHPIFFRQMRVGLNEQIFMLLKFRTMRELFDHEGKPLPDEHRLTRFGRFLRSTSLDELPELLNVIKGEMSLVGPRPLLERYLPRYSAKHARRHDVRPGLTGLAQVSGRNAVSWDQRLDMDVHYVENASLMLDLLILFKTIGAVVRRDGITDTAGGTMAEFPGSSEDDH